MGDGKNTGPDALPLLGKQYERALSDFLESTVAQGTALDTDDQVDGERVRDPSHEYRGG